MSMHHIYAWCPQRSDPVELELQTVVGHTVWVLGREPRASNRICAVNCCTISSLLKTVFILYLES